MRFFLHFTKRCCVRTYNTFTVSTEHGYLRVINGQRNRWVVSLFARMLSPMDRRHKSHAILERTLRPYFGPHTRGIYIVSQPNHYCMVDTYQVSVLCLLPFLFNASRTQNIPRAYIFILDISNTCCTFSVFRNRNRSTNYGFNRLDVNNSKLLLQKKIANRNLYRHTTIHIIIHFSFK